MDLAYFLAIGPFILLLVLLLWKRIPLLKVSLFTLALISLTQIFYWKITPLFVLNSAVRGFLVAFDIFIIIFGAIFFLEIIKATKIIDHVSMYLENAFKDYRIQVILLAWFLENFIEGTAGFGTPCAVVAPLLVGLGLPPITAVIVSLLGNSTSVAFGAAGTPIRVGLAGLDITSVPEYTAAFGIVGILVPVFMIWFVAGTQTEKARHFREALPYALWSGVAFVVPSLLLVKLGQEFPSLLGSIIGLVIILITTRLGLFVPKNTRVLRQLPSMEIKYSLPKIIFPYALLVIFLITGKYVLGTINLNFPWGFKYIFNLYNPGWAFILAGLPAAVFWGDKGLIFNSFKQAFLRTLNPFLVILTMSTSVQLMINSGNNYSGISSSLEIIAKGFEHKTLPFIAPFVGAFGSFITGSATIANIMFGNLLDSAAKVMYMKTSVILALGLSGAAAGNMFALADVLAAETVVGLKNQTSQIVKGVLLPCLIYLSILGLIGIIITQ